MKMLFSSESFDMEEDLSLCAACGSGGRLAAQCRSCAARFHEECAAPRQRLSRRFQCEACSNPRSQGSQRRCAAAAICNIQQYAREINNRTISSDSEDSEYNSSLGALKAKKSRGSKEPSPLPNGTSKRGRKQNVLNGSTRKSKTNQITNGVHEETKSSRKRGRKEPEEVLHTEALTQLLRDVMRHKDCWPFYEPVTVEEVPDYLDVIATPMDFTTIRNKLDREQYDTDAALIADAALVFSNCYTYNKDTHPVAKAGMRLEKYMNKRCTELSLPALPDTSIPAEEDPPTAKRPKLD